MLIFRGLGQLLTFASIIVLSRHLGTELFGTYSFLYGIMIFFTIPLTPALNDLMVKVAVNNPERKVEVLRAGLTLRLVSAVAVLILAVLIIPLLKVQNISFLMICAAASGLLFSLSFTSWRFGLEGFFQTDFRMDLASGVNLAGRLVLLGLLIIGAMTGAGIGSMIMLQAMGEIAATALLVIIAIVVGYSLKPIWKSVYIKRLFIGGLPLIWTEMLTLAYTRSGVLFLQAFKGEREVGLFSAPLRLVDALQLLPTIFLVSAVPIISRIYAGSRDRFDDAVRLSYKTMLLIALPIAALFSVYGNELILILFGEGFRAAGQVLVIAAWIIPFSFTSATFRAILISMGKQRHLPFLLIILVITNIALNLYCVPRFGAVGGGWAIMLTYTVLFPASLLRKETRSLGLMFFRTVLIPLVVCLLICWLVSYAGISIWIGGPALVLFIPVLAFISGWFGKSEMKKLQEFVGRS